MRDRKNCLYKLKDQGLNFAEEHISSCVFFRVRIGLNNPSCTNTEFISNNLPLSLGQFMVSDYCPGWSNKKKTRESIWPRTF